MERGKTKHDAKVLFFNVTLCKSNETNIPFMKNADSETSDWISS